ncbi:MAG: hypothetical protein H7288_17920 [Kineosporiaceae bacterium]|nr:hypothetical protein [Aeromicrobium sp.]
MSQRIEYTELTYEHAKSAHDPLLAIPDSVAWAWAKGGDWRRRSEPKTLTSRSHSLGLRSHSLALSVTPHRE